MEALSNLPGFPLFIIVLLVFSLGSILVIIATSFLKIVVVIHIMKNALGLHEVPPGSAINALALVLTIYIMAPVGMDALEIFNRSSEHVENFKDPKVLLAARESATPLVEFLKKHSLPRERQFFLRSADKLWPPEHAAKLKEDNLLVLLPAFTISQLKSAFEVGFLIYLPFIAIDLIIANILLALGMIMVSPVVISLPFKLLLFVLVDGWSLLLHSLVLSYR